MVVSLSGVEEAMIPAPLGRSRSRLEIGRSAASYVGAMGETSKERTVGGELKLQIGVLSGLLLILWLVEVVDLVFFGGSLDAYGIAPRSVDGLMGIPLAPILHGGLAHLAANTVPLLVLAWLVMLRETWHLPVVAAIVVLLGGLGVWLFGRAGSVHIGASGLVFGLLGFLLLAGWFERRLGAILLSLVVLVAYGGLLVGLLPGGRGVSWEAHLFGFAAGVLAARLLARRRPRGERARP